MHDPHRRRQRPWYESPWTWIIGCGGCSCLLLILSPFLLVGGVGVGALGSLRNLDVVKDAVQLAEADERVQAALGTPLERGWLPQGSINLTNGEGEADMSIPVEGPKGKGVVHFQAVQNGGDSWRFDILEVEIEATGEIIVLAGQTEPR
ncbi:MAG: cytochrome c oxidase assembly factor Coa1 family protein [Acidobacteriota bacterium]